MGRGAASGPGFGALLLGVGYLLGCSTAYIPNTDVPDTGNNRDVVSFCEKYRHAVEKMDVETLLDLASDDYYEDGGNTDASDDIDIAGLEEYLAAQFVRAESMRYEIRYRRIQHQPPFVFIDYTFSGSYRVPTSKGSKWQSTVQENRLELVADGESYRIVRGM